MARSLGSTADAGTWRRRHRRTGARTLKRAALWPAYWLHYAAEWFVSVLADTYGALLLAVLTKWFYESGSAETNG